MERGQFMAACARGAAAMELALRSLHRDYAGPLMREGMLMLGDRDRASDGVQGTLIRAWQACATYRGESELYAWLKQILRHLVIDELRRRSTEPLEDDEGQVRAEVEEALQRDRAGALPAPEASLFDAELERLYRRCAEAFEAEHPMAANVIRWVAEDDLPLDEVARLLGRSPGATREYVCQCRKKARKAFAPWYEAVRSRRPA